MINFMNYKPEYDFRKHAPSKVSELKYYPEEFESRKGLQNPVNGHYIRSNNLQEVRPIRTKKGSNSLLMAIQPQMLQEVNKAHRSVEVKILERRSDRGTYMRKCAIMTKLSPNRIC